MGTQTLFEEYEIKNSIKNKLDYSDRRFHDWYRFVLSYPPHLVRQYIQEFNLRSKDIVLDPFCGTGTTLVQSKLQNIRSIGIEANPFVHFASSVKTDWEIDTTALRKYAEAIANKAKKELLKQGITDVPSIGNMKIKDLRSLNAEQEKLILKNSIADLPLHKSLTLFELINHYQGTNFYKYFVLALGNSLVYEISNLRFGPEVGVGKNKPDSPVIDIWL